MFTICMFILYSRYKSIGFVWRGIKNPRPQEFFHALNTSHLRFLKFLDPPLFTKDPFTSNVNELFGVLYTYFIELLLRYVGLSSNSLYQGFAEKYCLGIYLHSKKIPKKKGLKPIRKLGVRVHRSDQWRYQVDLFALKCDFCVICFILIYILLYSVITINGVLFYAN